MSTAIAVLFPAIAGLLREQIMKMLYKKGSMYRLREGWVDHKEFSDEQIDQAIADGWVLNPLDLFKPATNEERTALEEQAKALGVAFNSRTSDETLKTRIAEANAVEV